MRRSEQQYREALRAFNRSAGQLKRWHNINPEEYLNAESKTEKGVRRALDKMRLDAELESIPDIDDLEEDYDELEEAAKEADFEEKERQYEQARETIRERFDIDMDETEYDIFWRAFDDPDILDAFGSTNVLYMGEEVRNDDTVTTKQAAEIAKGTAAKAIGSGMTSEEIRDAYNINFAAYKEARGLGLSHREAIEDIFK